MNIRRHAHIQKPTSLKRSDGHLLRGKIDLFLGSIWRCAGVPEPEKMMLDFFCSCALLVDFQANEGNNAY